MTRRAAATCVTCTRPTSGSNLCHDCYTTTRHQLGDLAGPPHPGTRDHTPHTTATTNTSLDLFTTLEAAIERGTRTTRPGPTSNVPSSTPAANLDALHDRDTAENLLFPWYRHLVADLNLPPTPITGQAMADTLATHATWLHRTPHTQPATRAIAKAHALLLTRVDIALERHYLGPCVAILLDGQTCTGDVHQIANHIPECDTCGAIYGRDDRIEWVASMAQDQLATAAELAGSLSAWGMHITPDLVRKWAERKRIQARGTTPEGHPLYRFGDARALALDTIKRRKGGKA